jgi:3-deoxy-D-manno-octulosonate 8-phosphate phosphatase (KDO 8-P phosphatase)
MNTGLNPQDFVSRALRLRLILTDCDGVLTDGGVYYSERGEELKRFNIRDGMAVERLRKLAGIETGIVTGEMSASVARRAEKLAITELHLGTKDKAATVRAVMERLNLGSHQVAYVGDDVNDLPAFAVAGLTACPGDAFSEVRAAADVVLNRPGGHGVFREFAELVLKARADHHGADLAAQADGLAPSRL